MFGLSASQGRRDLRPARTAFPESVSVHGADAGLSLLVIIRRLLRCCLRAISRGLPGLRYRANRRPGWKAPRPPPMDPDRTSLHSGRRQRRAQRVPHSPRNRLVPCGQPLFEETVLLAGLHIPSPRRIGALPPDHRSAPGLRTVGYDRPVAWPIVQQIRRGDAGNAACGDAVEAGWTLDPAFTVLSGGGL